MKAIISIAALLGLLLSFPPKGYGQTGSNGQDSTALNLGGFDQAGYYRSTLHVDSAKAAAISIIQSQYKTALDNLAAMGLPADQLPARVDALMADKNRQLGLLLSPEEQLLIIPTTELKKTTEGTNANGQ